ncbi:MAG: energy-coupling factor transporter transmembrane component T [Spirochaetales bacterium]|nr:energy-coupling factor transporter transmembrane component T [Spirochaetales bacterium]
MKELDFTQKASLGQYLPGNSFLHHLIPQVKLAGIILLTGGTLYTSPLLGTLFSLLAVMVLGKLARVPTRFLLRNVKPIIPFLSLIALMQLFFTNTGESPVLWELGRFTISEGGLYNGLAVFFRFFSLMGLFTLFTAVTPSREIGHGTENLTAPLAKIGFPSHAFSLIITITFRFIPILTGEAEYLIKAQASRGARIGMGKNPLKKIASYLPLLVPLFISSLQRAEQLAEAMEARCYQKGEKRSRYVNYPFALRDGLSLIIIAILTSVLILLQQEAWEEALIPFIRSFL